MVWDKDIFLQRVGVKDRVCWCECWQIARRCRTLETHPRPPVLTAADFFERTEVQKYSLKDGLAGLLKV